MRTRASKAAVVAFLVLTGCPKRFDPRAETVRSSPDPEADHAYREARARLDVGDFREAETEFAAFLERYPNDPLAGSARVGEARAALQLGEAKKARSLVEPMAGQAPPGEDPLITATRTHARYVLGLALHRTGEWQRSRELLQPFVSMIAGGDQAVELHAVLADDALQAGDAAGALREFDVFYRGARPAEQLYVRDRVSALVDKLSPGDATALWNELPRDGVVATYLGRRMGVVTPKHVVESGGAARVIGCLLPLSGRGRALGQRALRGALLGAGVLPGMPGAIPLEVRDTGSDPARAQAAVDELAQAGAVAIVGTPERSSAQAAAPRAEALGVPFLELSPDSTPRGELTFKLVRPRSAAAAALVQRAARSGARTVAILAPDSAYGRSMAEELLLAARAARLRVVADLRFPDGATTFVEPVRRLKTARPDALLIPAAAYQLALIAPQLTASGVTGMPGVRPTGKQARLYATADGLSAGFLQSTAKYLQGAVLAPTYYPDEEDPAEQAFVERYRAAYGEEPGVLDALAFDAVRAARIALDRAGGASRGALATELGHLGEHGLTGTLSFSAAGDRSGPPPLYVVDGDGLHAIK